MSASLIALILLSGCGRTVFEPRLEVFCPSLKSYSEQFNEQLADEVQSLPAGTATETALIDYIELRDRIRTCTEVRDQI
jgi:Tfp pilus assembly protein PilP